MKHLCLWKMFVDSVVKISTTLPPKCPIMYNLGKRFMTKLM